MNWNYIMIKQPKNGDIIIQCDQPIKGIYANQDHYYLGMREYRETISFDVLLKQNQEFGYPNPDYYWILASEFQFPQPERLNPKTHFEEFFAPPWDMTKHPEKTEGWIEFQRAMKKDPSYYSVK